MFEMVIDNIKTSETSKLDSHSLSVFVGVGFVAFLSKIDGANIGSLRRRCVNDDKVLVNDIAIAATHPNFLHNFSKKPFSIIWNVCHIR